MNTKFMASCNDWPSEESLPDLSSCDREQVQFIGAIQPHGMLMALEEPGLTLCAVSANTRQRLHQLPSEMLNLRLDQALPNGEAGWILERLKETNPGRIPVQLGPVVLRDREYEVFAYRIAAPGSGTRVILEFEQTPRVKPTPSKLYADVRACMAELQAALTSQDLVAVAVRHIRRITGYDRVLGTEFLGDGTVHVIAEDKREDLKSHLGLHYPPGDIPAPARRILSLVWVRHQPDIAYVPVPIESCRPDAEPLDLSFSLLRSTSAMCNRHYLNQGIYSKLLVALLSRGEFRGFIVCQHGTAREVAHETRVACETIAHAVSLALGDKEKAAGAREAERVRLNLQELCRRIADLPSWAAQLEEGFWSAVPSGGAAALVNDGTALKGVSPSEEQVREISAWLDTLPQFETESVYATNCLPARFSPAGAYSAAASGLLAVRLGLGEYLMWFRPEIPYQVTWAGDPLKFVETDPATGQLRLAPRTSFDMRPATLRGLSEEWKPYERETALALRGAVLTARRESALADRVGELSVSNARLESFAYTAAHDLRTPLRGIHTSSEWLAEELGGTLGGEDKARLETIQRLSLRMDELLRSLMDFSRAGLSRQDRQPVDLNVLFDEVRETIAHEIEAAGAVVVRSGALPVLTCDREQIHGVLMNLIVNGLKYNASAEKVVEVGCRAGAEKVICVKDNGIGIPADQHESVFTLFRRLHRKGEFGGGNGAGLAIARRAVENHGGRMWIESEPGAGSTFCFTLPG